MYVSPCIISMQARNGEYLHSAVVNVLHKFCIKTQATYALFHGFKWLVNLLENFTKTDWEEFMINVFIGQGINWNEYYQFDFYPSSRRFHQTLPNLGLILGLRMSSIPYPKTLDALNPS